MKILVLGSGAGGGFPQWNCNCRLCAGHRQGALAAHARTQSSIAVSPDGHSWVLLNASPDIGTQIRNHPQLHPRDAGGKQRNTPIKAVVLMDAQIDHVTGLLGLREGPRIDLYATPCVFEDLTTGLPLLNVLEHYCGTRWHMYVGLGRANHVAFVDTATRKTQQLVLVGKRAWGLGLNRDGSRLFVVNGLSDDMTVIDTVSAKPIKTLPVGRVPHTVVVDD